MVGLVVAVGMLGFASPQQLSGRELEVRVGAECCGGFDANADCTIAIPGTSGHFGNCLSGDNATCQTSTTKKCENSAGSYMLNDTGCS